jgi:hypothetical protein
MSKISVGRIVKDHFRTLKNDNDPNRGILIGDLLLFFGLPGIPAYLLAYFEIFLDKEFIEILIGALSIFVGLFLNVLVLIIDLTKSEETINLKKRLGNQLHSNISFSILLSLFAIIFCLASLGDFHINFLKLTNLISYFLLFSFMMHLLMVLKRVYSLFQYQD